MSNDLPRRQKINIELAEKANNTHLKNILSKLLPRRDRNKEKIMFECECSDPQCNKKVPLTIEEYEHYHKNAKQFILAKGHTAREIEKPVFKKKSYTVVKKYSLS